MSSYKNQFTFFIAVGHAENLSTRSFENSTRTHIKILLHDIVFTCKYDRVTWKARREKTISNGRTSSKIVKLGMYFVLLFTRLLYRDNENLAHYLDKIILYIFLPHKFSTFRYTIARSRVVCQSSCLATLITHVL